jgi:MFS superfamily sulfate permease-like transporter
MLAMAATVAIVLLFLTKPLRYMPNAVLAAVVFVVGIKLIDIRQMRQILRLRPDEFWIAAATAAVVIGVGVEQGIILAIILSLLEHVRRHYTRTTALSHETITVQRSRTPSSPGPTPSRDSLSTGSEPAFSTLTPPESPRRRWPWSTSRRRLDGSSCWLTESMMSTSPAAAHSSNWPRNSRSETSCSPSPRSHVQSALSSIVLA